MDKPKVIKLGNLKGNSQGYRVYDSRGVCAPITTNGGGIGRHAELWVVDEREDKTNTARRSR